MNTCPRCGTTTDGLFCPKCGARVAAPEPKPEPETIPEAPVTEAPEAAPVPETPAPEAAPVPETPAPEAEAPKAEAPAPEAPAPEAKKPEKEPEKKTLTKADLPKQFRPLGAWAYFGWTILFSIPVIGFILLIVFSFVKSNINRRNFARSWWLVYLLVFILCLAGAIAALIAFGGFAALWAWISQYVEVGF